MNISYLRLMSSYLKPDNGPKDYAKTLGSYGSVFEGFDLVACDAASLVEQLPTLRRNPVPSQRREPFTQ